MVDATSPVTDPVETEKQKKARERREKTAATRAAKKIKADQEAAVQAALEEAAVQAKADQEVAVEAARKEAAKDMLEKVKPRIAELEKRITDLQPKDGKETEPPVKKPPTKPTTTVWSWVWPQANLALVVAMAILFFCFGVWFFSDKKSEPNKPASVSASAETNEVARLEKRIAMLEKPAESQPAKEQAVPPAKMEPQADPPRMPGMLPTAEEPQADPPQRMVLDDVDGKATRFSERTSSTPQNATQNVTVDNSAQGSADGIDVTEVRTFSFRGENAVKNAPDVCRAFLSGSSVDAVDRLKQEKSRLEEEKAEMQKNLLRMQDAKNRPWQHFRGITQETVQAFFKRFEGLEGRIDSLAETIQQLEGRVQGSTTATNKAVGAMNKSREFAEERGQEYASALEEDYLILKKGERPKVRKTVSGKYIPEDGPGWYPIQGKLRHWDGACWNVW